MSDVQKPKHFNFDPTVNLGHVLTFIGFIVSGFLAYQNVDKRISVLEEGRKTQELRDQYQDAQAASQNKFMQEILVEIKKTLEKLDQKIEQIRNK